MRQKPDISEDSVTACLRIHYDIDAISVRFLPIGYDLNAFVYQAIAADDVHYFVKIRVGAVNPASLVVPRALIDQGIPNILAPLKTTTQALSCALGPYSVVAYPFIRGENAMIAGLSDSQWREFGASLQAIHAGGFASLLDGQVPVETFSLPSAPLVRRLSALIQTSPDALRAPTSRKISPSPPAQRVSRRAGWGVRSQFQDTDFESPAASRLAAFWASNSNLIEYLLARAEDLGKQLQTRQFENVLCHADIHAANILVSEDGGIYVVDWDGPLLAPRERDLLFIVGSVIARTVEPREEALFFEGYGAADVDMSMLAYYRYERAIEDIGETGRSVFLEPDLNEEVTTAEAELFRSLFEPGQIVEAAMEADPIKRNTSFQ